MNLLQENFPIKIASQEFDDAKIISMCYFESGTDKLLCWEVYPGSKSSPILVNYSNARFFWILQRPLQITSKVARFYVEILQFFKTHEQDLLYKWESVEVDKLHVYNRAQRGQY